MNASPHFKSKQYSRVGVFACKAKAKHKIKAKCKPLLCKTPSMSHIVREEKNKDTGNTNFALKQCGFSRLSEHEISVEYSNCHDLQSFHSNWKLAIPFSMSSFQSVFLIQFFVLPFGPLCWTFLSRTQGLIEGQFLQIKQKIFFYIDGCLYREMSLIKTHMQVVETQFMCFQESIPIISQHRFCSETNNFSILLLLL